MVTRRLILTGITLGLTCTFVFLKPSAPSAGGLDAMTGDVLRSLLTEHRPLHKRGPSTTRMGRLSRLADEADRGDGVNPQAAAELAVSRDGSSSPQLVAAELAPPLYSGAAKPLRGVDWGTRLSAKTNPAVRGSNFQAAALAAATDVATSIVDFANAYIILLMRDANRVDLVTGLTRDEFPGAHIWPAIDGACISDDQVQDWKNRGYLKNRGFMNPASPSGKPKISCLMSHVQVWEQLANSSDPYYLILEDDAIPSVDFHTRYPAILAELADLNWDWVYLAIHPTFASKNKKAIEGKMLINRAPSMVGNAGYLLSRQGARKVLAGILPCSLPKDQAVRKMIESGDLEGYIVKKELIVVTGQQGQGNSSMVKDSRRKHKSNIFVDAPVDVDCNTD